MADLTDAQIDAAMARGKLALESEPRAAAARYDPALDRMVIELTTAAPSPSRPGSRRASSAQPHSNWPTSRF